MGNFNRKNFSRGNDRRGDRREDRQMYRATCADCGKSCEVPFRPSGDKPVYCSNCFKRDGDSRSDSRGNFRGGSRGDSRGDSRGGSRGEGRPEMHRATCADCGKSCEVPFRPSGGKPVYCSNCFDKGADSGPNKPNQSKHDEINAKLDKILFLLQRTNSVKEVTVMKPKKDEEAPKVSKKAPAKKAPVKKAPVKKAPVKKMPAKKAPAKKKGVSKKAAKKTPAKKKAK